MMKKMHFGILFIVNVTFLTLPLKCDFEDQKRIKLPLMKVKISTKICYGTCGVCNALTNQKINIYFLSDDLLKWKYTLI
jgi:hypothetical protein